MTLRYFVSKMKVGKNKLGSRRALHIRQSVDNMSYFFTPEVFSACVGFQNVIVTSRNKNNFTYPILGFNISKVLERNALHNFRFFPKSTFAQRGGIKGNLFLVVAMYQAQPTRVRYDHGASRRRFKTSIKVKMRAPCFEICGKAEFERGKNGSNKREIASPYTCLSRQRLLLRHALQL